MTQPISCSSHGYSTPHESRITLAMERAAACFVMSAQQLPRLPDPRPRPLTPPGFRVSESHGPPYALFQETCAYFRLPPNIRNDILRLAFGDRRLHLSLAYCHSQAAQCPDYHLRNGSNYKESQNPALVGKKTTDWTSPRAWRWANSFCHRPVPNAEDGPPTRGGPDGPWADRCCSGNTAHCCYCTDRYVPSICRTGVMGWLLSCRQK